MKRDLKNLEGYFLIFILIIFILISYIFLNRDNISIEDFIMISIFIFSIVLSYCLEMIKGLISSILIVFIYTSYGIYLSMVNNLKYPDKIYFWIILIPVVSVVVGKISTKIKYINSEIIELNSKYNNLITIDSKTGLTNIKGFYRDLNREISRCNRHSLSMVLMYIRLPFKKELKSLLGEKEFNKLMNNVSKIIEQCIRNEDISYHLENDNLAILMFDTDINGSEIVSERIRSSIMNQNIQTKSNKKFIKIDIQIGLKEFNKDIKNALEFQKLAEKEADYDV